MGKPHSTEDRALAEAFAAFVLRFGEEGLAALKAEAERTGRRPSDLIRGYVPNETVSGPLKC